MDLDGLYQEIILDHARSPRGRAELSDGEVLAEERNPLCGDSIRLAVKRSGDRIESVRFDGHGCAISTASASLMAEFSAGRPVEELRRVSAQVVRWLRSEGEAPEGVLEELQALGGVRQFPMRIKCATLCWHALDRALDRLEIPPGPANGPSPASA
jgi:nitrogen fixation NifU-like protein